MPQETQNSLGLKRFFIVLIIILIIFFILFGLSFHRGARRGCTAVVADATGANWLIVTYNLYGDPFRCWELHEVAVTNESQSDGIYWKEANGNLVHLSGFYNRIQVTNGNWEAAFASLGITQEQCHKVQNRTLKCFDVTRQNH